jgi:hypothetical protein
VTTDAPREILLLSGWRVTPIPQPPVYNPAGLANTGPEQGHVYEWRRRDPHLGFIGAPSLYSNHPNAVALRELRARARQQPSSPSEKSNWVETATFTNDDKYEMASMISGRPFVQVTRGWQSTVATQVESGDCDVVGTHVWGLLFCVFIISVFVHDIWQKKKREKKSLFISVS